MVSIKIKELFKEEIGRGISFFEGARDTTERISLTDEEVDAVERVMDIYTKHLSKISPTVADLVERQRSVALKMAEVAKATFTVEKSITYPGTAGNIGINFLVPQAIRYVATPTATSPAYTDYPANSWTLSLTAGTAEYLLGSTTNYYRANPADNNHVFFFVFEDGIIEVGSTPSFNQFYLEHDGFTKYAPWTTHSLVDIDVEKLVYIYNTIGVIPVYHNLGIKLSAMPTVTKTSEVRLLGLYFYEFDFHKTLKWVS